MRPSEATHLVARLFALYPNVKVAPETVAGYAERLCDLDYDMAERAITVLVEEGESDFLPTVRGIRRCYFETEYGAPSATVAYEDLMQRLEKHTTRDAHPHTLRTMRALGGEWEFRNSERPDILRRSFEEVYDALLKEEINTRNRMSSELRDLPVAEPQREMQSRPELES
jgi:hypothetical protein